MDEGLKREFLYVMRVTENMNQSLKGLLFIGARELISDVPDQQGNIDGYVHSLRQSKDWQKLKNNDELFLKLNGEIIRFEEEEPYIPVFINEAAYMEKNIAMSFTKRELWDFKKEWKQSLIDLVHQK